ncbi:uncharacterized protein PAC_03342 [Phialocephala subalpina]|uniref:Uncharacterized protein n=1 Tax=Phialocephala subalpina TaxID=576137 RepID=A0A1L7WL27_9HELO|nr:uncharacterized protein PAC_03342 [Phialocephala subalpina]
MDRAASYISLIPTLLLCPASAAASASYAAKMSEEQAAGRCKKGRLERWKSAQPGWFRPFSRDHSRQSSRTPSPVRRGKADDAPTTADASSSTPKIRPGVNHEARLVAGANAVVLAVKLEGKPDNRPDDNQNVESDDDEDAELDAATGRSRDQENSNTDPDAAGSAQENDMWKIAEAQLRLDKKQTELLDAYYDILKSKLKKDLNPAGTLERQKQISAFIVSESKGFRDTSKLGKFASVLKKGADCILKAEAVISAASQPCLPASVACAGVMLVLSLCTQAGSQRDVLFKGLWEIPDVIYDLAENEKLHWTDAQDPVFKTSMTKLCSHILEFLARAACHLEKHPITRTLKDMFNQVEWDTLLSAIKDAEARVYNHSAVNGWKDVRMIREAQEKGQLAQQTATLSKETAVRNEKITAFLQKLNEYAWPGGDSYEYSKERVQRAEEGTCKWFTNHDKFKAWECPENPNTGSPLLLLTAYPGCGKSVLSKHLIDTVLSKLNDRTVCYFFFKDDFEHQRSATGALCTLLHQLLIISESKRRTSLADSAFRRLETMGKESFFGSVSSLWKTFTEAALHTDAGEVICILDALDECQPNGRNELIKAINEFYRTPRNQASCLLKLFLTTRPYGDIIQSQFSYVWGHKLPEIRLAGEEDDVANDIAEEIKIVVDKRIDQICDTFHLTKQKSNLMKTNLGAAPGRTYLWITLIFDDLLKKTSGISKEYIESFVKNPPKDVDDAYEKILNRSKTQGLGNQDLKKTRNILQMIIAARRPLTLGEMSIALLLLEHQPPYQDLADEMESKEGIWDIIRDCCGLLVIRVDERLYLLHQTVREFLVATGPDINNENQKAQDTPDSGTITPHSYFWKYSIDLTDANSVLAEACISYLYSNFSKTDDSLLDYSAIYWIDHYRQSRQNCQVAVANMTRDICLPSEPRAKWTKIHNKHNRIPATGSLLCLASALGLDSFVEEFLHEQNLIGIDLEAVVDSDDSGGRTPLSWAAENGHEAAVKLLLASKAEVDSKDICDHTPLSWAAENGREAIVKLLLASKAKVNSKDSHNWTPLSWAAKNGHEAIVKLLLASKAEVNSKDNHSRTPLLWAAENGHEAIVKLLLASKAEVDSNGSDGLTPLSDGQTPLSLAAKNGYEAIVKLLLASKAEVDSKDSDNQTPLSWAARNGHKAIVKLLLASKAEVDSKNDSYGQTPLSWAAENGHEATVKLLLASKAKVNSKDYHNRTPLSLAAKNGHEAIVKLLLASKAAVDSKDGGSRTPLWWAAKNGHEAVVKLLSGNS